MGSTSLAGSWLVLPMAMMAMKSTLTGFSGLLWISACLCTIVQLQGVPNMSSELATLVVGFCMQVMPVVGC